MPAKHISILAKDDLIFSQNAATGGEHQALDHIPGSALLGAVASSVYRTLASAEEQWLAFHSGKIRFGNAYPTSIAGKSSYPVSMSFHHIKGTKPLIDGKLSDYSDLSSQDRDNSKGQLKQLRSGYLQADLSLITADMDYTMKTAIDYHTGTAKDSQLFGYSMLRSGQWFCGELSWDEEVEITHPHIIQAIIERLSSGQIRLGRAKSAEFGRVSIALADVKETVQLKHRQDEQEISILCYSDIALCRADGSPLFQIDAEVLGLPELTPVTNKTFVRTRQYSPYNAARQAYDQERQVIAKGSVFTFKVKNVSDELLNSLKKMFAEGIGRHRESGLGQIRPCLVPEPDNDSDKSVPSMVAACASMPETDLLQWLSKRAGAVNSTGNAEAAAQQLFELLETQYKQARQLAAVDNGQAFGPNKHNWGRILDLADSSNDDASLLNGLFNSTNPLILTAEPENIKKDDNWQVELVDEKGHFISFANWFKQTIDSQNLPANTPLRSVLQLLSRRAMSAQLELFHMEGKA